MNTNKILSFVMLMIIMFALLSCNDPARSPDDNLARVDTIYVYGDTVYLDSLVTDTLWLSQLQENDYYWLICSGINGVDTLANLWLKNIEPSDTLQSGWEFLLFSADPESSVYNARDFYITHAPVCEGE